MGYLGNVRPTIALVADDITDGAVTSAKIAADAVTAAKIGANQIGNSELDLTAAYAFTGSLTGAVVNNMQHPCFEANNSSNQSMSDNVEAKVVIDTIQGYNVGSAFDNSTNYRFQPQVGGHYFVYGRVHCYAGNDNMSQAYATIKKNGTASAQSLFNYYSGTGSVATPWVSVVMGLNGSSDYAELFATIDATGGSPHLQSGTPAGCFFGAFRIN